MDYVRDAGEAEKIKEQYKLSSPTDKDLVIFDCGGRIKIVPGDALTQYTLEQVPNDKEREFRRKPVAFNGEMMFTSMLLAVENPKPFKAYFLQGHGEPSLTDTGEAGYLKFGAVLARKLHRDRTAEPARRQSGAGGLQPAHHRRAARPLFSESGTAEN